MSRANILFKECFGDLPTEEQVGMKHILNAITENINQSVKMRETIDENGAFCLKPALDKITTSFYTNQNLNLGDK